MRKENKVVLFLGVAASIFLIFVAYNTPGLGAIGPILLLFFIVLPVTLVGFILNIVIIKPIKNLANDMEVEIENSKQRFQKQLKLIEKSKKLEKESEEYLESFRQTVSDGQAMSSILAEIEATASENGMKVSDVKPKRVKKVDFYNQFSVSLSINGQLKDIARFLYALQNLPHLFNVDEFVLEKNVPSAPVMDCRVVLSRIFIP